MFKSNQRLGHFIAVILLVFSLFLAGIPSSTATSPKVFDLIEITDFHGYLQDSGKLSDGTVITQQRAAVIAKQIKGIKAANPNTIVLSGGDMFQGTPLSNVLKGQPVIAMMNNIGFDAMALGNHEYDWGIDTVVNRQTATLKDSEIPLLAANVYDKVSDKPVDYLKQYILLKRGGVKIGIIGVVDHTEFPSIIMPVYIQNIVFKDPVPIVNNLAAQLRKDGAQLIVVIAHMGAISAKKTGISSGNLADFANRVTGVDAILGGHTHTIVNTKIRGIPVGVAGCYGQGYIDLKLTLKPDGKFHFKSITYHNIFKLYNTAVPVVDPQVQELVAEANQTLGTKFHEVIGTAAANLTRRQSAKPYGDSALGNWAAEVTRKAVNADFGFANNGGLRIDIPEGGITVGEMFQLMPFDNTIVTLKMTGAQVKILLEQAVQDNGKGIQIAGLSFSYDPAKPSMQRILSIKKADGARVDPAGLYLVAVNNFMATGGDGFGAFTDPAVAKTFTDTGILVRDVLIEAVKAQKIITPAVDNRIKPETDLETSKTGFIKYHEAA